MENIFKADVKRIKEASNAGKLVIFVGAGVSANSGVPTWWGLMESLKKELPKDLIKGEDYLKIAQLYKNYREHKEYLEKIRTELKHGLVKPCPIHDAILGLNPAHIITTNYDDLLEQAALKNNAQYYPIRKDTDLPYASYDKFIIKMHGDFDEGNIVLTEDDYLNYEANFPLIDSYVKSLVASKLMLFIGFSFDDYNLKFITNKVKNLLSDDFQPIYLLLPKKADFLSRDYYKKRGVRIVEYGLTKEEDENLNTTYQQDLSKISHPTGQKLHKLIRYINDYRQEPFKERWKKAITDAPCKENKENILDVLYDIIEHYFSEIDIIGGKELLNFYPLSEDRDARYSYFTLSTSIFSGVAEKIKQDLRKSFKTKRDFLTNPKYRKVIEFARMNGIFEIELVGTKEEKAIMSPSDEKEHIGMKSLFALSKKTIMLPDYEKGYIGTKYLFALDFKKLVEYVNEAKAKKSGEITIDSLEYPYLLYRLGRYDDAYLKYREIAQECWRGKKYILYLICQLNLQNIGSLIKRESEPKNFLKLMIKEDKAINLKNVWSKLHVQDKKLYQIIQKVYDFRQVYELTHYISTLTDKIGQTSNNIKQGGWAFNQDVKILTEKTWSLWNFTNNNFIASEHYDEHLFIYRKAFEGFLVSNNIPDGKSSKLQSLQEFHIIIGHVS